MRPIVCLVTDRRRLAGSDSEATDAVVAQVAAAARANVDLVQVRERDLESAALLDLVSRCLIAARGSRLRILVNDRLDVALAAGAHGVHLRADSIDPARARSIVPEGFVLGRSVHALDEAREVAATGAVDHVIFGTVFPTISKPDLEKTAGVERLDRVARAVAVPVLAIGGVDDRTLPLIAATAAAGFAAVGYLAGPDLDQAVRRARETFRAAATSPATT